LIILALGAATLWMNKRKRQGTRHIQVVETASLGPKRSLALVVVGRQSLLLSCSESGIFLVSSQPATAEMLEGSDQRAAGVSPVELPTPLFGRAAPTAAPGSQAAQGGFAVQLAEAEETQGLRRRLSEAGVLR
jgi:flagellar biogenesis protein FliO